MPPKKRPTLAAGAGPSGPPPSRRRASVHVKPEPTAASAPSGARRARSTAPPSQLPPPPALPPAAAAAGLAIDADPMSFLTDGAAAFWAETWQKRAAFFKATAARQAWVAACLPSMAALLDRAAAGGRPLLWGVDVVAARYADDTRTDLNTAPDGMPASPGDRRRLMAMAGATLQVHHPQRFDGVGDGAWRLVSALERDLGCLVGTNSYLTPAGGAQGLAPHWDDVEVWVVQVEGRKAWRVYQPRPDEERLKIAPSGDLPPFAGPESKENKFLRQPNLEVTLSPGDVLYIPRGWIHQATSLDDASNHLTISSFQSWTVADLAAEAVRVAAGGTDALPTWTAFKKSRGDDDGNDDDDDDGRYKDCYNEYGRFEFGRLNRYDYTADNGHYRPRSIGFRLRHSLPPGAAYRGGLGDAIHRHCAVAAQGGVDMGFDRVNRSKRSENLTLYLPPRKSGPAVRRFHPPSGPKGPLLPADAAGLAASLRAVADELEARPLAYTRTLYDATMDSFTADFFAHRMPPFPTQVAVRGPKPRLGSRVACRAPGCFRLTMSDCIKPFSKEWHDEYKSDIPAFETSTWYSVMSCLDNRRERHMVDVGGGSDDDDDETSGSELGRDSDDDGFRPASAPDIVLSVPRHFYLGEQDELYLATALAATPERPLTVVISDREEPNPAVEISIRLAKRLWEAGVIAVVAA